MAKTAEALEQNKSLKATEQPAFDTDEDVEKPKNEMRENLSEQNCKNVEV